MMNQPYSTAQEMCDMMDNKKIIEEGISSYQQGQYDMAASKFRMVLRNEPNNPDALHLLGVTMSQLGEYDEAQIHIEGAIKLSPMVSQFHNNLGNVYSSQGNLDDAEHAFKKAIELSPNNIEAYSNLAHAYLMQGDYQKALDHFQRALQCDPNEDELRLQCADCYLKLGNFERAVTLYSELAARYPSDGQLIYKLGVAYQSRGDYITALQQFQKTVQLEPTFADVYNRIGVIYFQVNEFDMAIDMFRLAIDYRINYVEAYCNMGNALLRRDEPENALQFYSQANKLDPQSPEIVNNMGGAYRALDDFDEAQNCFETAIEMDSSYVAAYENLAELQYANGDSADTEKTYQTAIERLPDSGFLHVQLGRFYLKQGKTKEAIDYFDRAAKLGDEALSGIVWLAKTAWLQGNICESLEWVKKAVKMAPNDVESHILLSSLYLLNADFEKGWKAYQWRWSVMEYANATFQSDLPRYQGEPLQDISLLLWLEDDISKNILNLSLLAEISEKVKRCALVCSATHKELLTATHPNVNFISQSDKSVNDYDYQLALGDLPLYLRQDLADFKTPTAFMSLSESQQLRYRDDNYKGRCVAICVGDLDEAADDIYKQSPDQPLWQELVNALDARFIEYAAADSQCCLSHVFAQESGINLSNNLLSTAEKLHSVDMIITADDPIAHLAAAMGKPVFLLLPSNPDWCWHRGYDSSLWYPQVRLIRLEKDWQSAMQNAQKLCQDWLST